MGAEQIGPQPGPQKQFLATRADIAIYGGAAGGGKSYALLLEPLRHHENPRFGGVIFRRTSPQLTGAGSLWEEAGELYRMVGARMIQSPTLEAQFPSGALLQFLHLQHPQDVYDHQGKQYAFIGFDELTHFESSQFWYLVSRLRSVSGVRPYMRCTTNPDPDSFVRDLIDWWIDDKGSPIQERSGSLRWFTRLNNALFWADTREELEEKYHEAGEPLSLTFIAAKLDDNPALTRIDPGYRARLMAMPEVERERLLGGNWDVRPDAGKYIKREYFLKRWSGEAPPLNIYTSSDYAVTPPEGDADPDYTEHAIWGTSSDGLVYLLDWWFGQTSSEVWIETLIDKFARWKPLTAFGEGGVIRRAVEPFLVRRMRERKVFCALEWINAPRAEPSASKEGYADPSKRAKARKARSFQAMAANGRVLFPARADWADRVIEQVVAFPSARYDDAFDVLALMGMAIDEAIDPVAPRPKANKPQDAWAKAFKPSTGKGWKTA